MDGNISGGEDDIDWNTDDELEIANYPVSSSSSLSLPGAATTVDPGEASCSAGPSNSMIRDFLTMGFPEKLIAKAIEENGEGDADSVLNTLLTYQAIENSSEPEEQKPIVSDLPKRQPTVDSDRCSSDDGSLFNDFSDTDISSGDEDFCAATADIQKIKEELTDLSSETNNSLLSLVDMGYSVDEASIAIQRCGPNSSILELSDFICAARLARAADADFVDIPEVKPTPYLGSKRRKFLNDLWKRKKPRGLERRDEDDETIRLPNPMIGFGVPGELCPVVNRTLPEAAIGPPFFYYENVALAPKGVWTTISRFLYDVEPEFVDSKYFCAAARKRGYVHNLPVVNRFPLVPLPPRTIHDALPLTRKWWPSWDTRTKLNCLQTCIASAKLSDRIRKALEDYDGNPPLHVQKYVFEECRKWNLVWVGRNKVAPLEPDEVEMLLGFPKNHTRGGGISRTDRYKSLGNSFQVDTVAYHLSVLKDIFPGGINLLSLFSGIGGAEVALHRLGIPLKNVVSVEISEVNRNIVRSWWEQTNQKGNLIDLVDVQQLNGDRLEQLMNSFGGFDLVVGGSPCNNLAGSNRYTRDGLEGKQSALFYDYFRILDVVKCVMSKSL